MRLAVLVGIGVLAGVAIVVSQYQPVQPAADLAPLANVVGEAQRAISRVPVSAMRMTDEAEVEIGTTLASDYRSRWEAPVSEVDTYVNRVGAAVAARAHRHLPYRFHVAQAPTFVNAFALPGGQVFLGTGLMALMTSEDELASVLAHEIEHVDHFHAIDLYQSERVRRGSVAGALITLPVDLFEAGYSKTQELEADAEGTRLAALAGYNPLALVGLLARMDRADGRTQTRANSPVSEVLTLPGGVLDAYFRSHPPGPERVVRIRDVVAQERLDATLATRPVPAAIAAAVTVKAP